MSRRQFSLVRHLCVLAAAKNNSETGITVGPPAAKTIWPRVADRDGPGSSLISLKRKAARLAPCGFWRSEFQRLNASLKPPALVQPRGSFQRRFAPLRIAQRELSSRAGSMTV